MPQRFTLPEAISDSRCVETFANIHILCSLSHKQIAARQHVLLRSKSNLSCRASGATQETMETLVRQAQRSDQLLFAFIRLLQFGLFSKCVNSISRTSSGRKRNQRRERNERTLGSSGNLGLMYEIIFYTVQCNRSLLWICFVYRETEVLRGWKD